MSKNLEGDTRFPENLETTDEVGWSFEDLLSHRRRCNRDSWRVFDYGKFIEFKRVIKLFDEKTQIFNETF